MNPTANTFEEYLLNSKYVSPLTAETYVKDINNHPDLVAKLPMDPANIYDTFSYLFTTNQSVHTINRIITSLRHYNEFLNKQQNKFTDETIPLTDQDIEAILAQPDVATFRGARDKAIITILCRTGICIAELLALNIGDVDVGRGLLFLRGHSKKFKERIIKMEHKDILVICMYMLKCSNYTDNTPLFMGTGNNQRLSRAWIWRIVRKYGKKAGVSDNITPSDLRIYFAEHLHSQGESINSIQSALGTDKYKNMQEYMSEYYLG